ncbi:uncharacterized mitochondrial protein AtMg00810-like [Nicotiana sylvestris]|uniref:Uncharacterized mitochondrial protein AtMg00810-like n=1 Tax=Nicotiana tabacum TaxID=4097 RepID=A0A1S3ZEQ2_TOBAC|nr:PREDICTED: uncharacterized mitochondrial protein AtMg00810-like [Nicotiana tabacum]
MFFGLELTYGKEGIRLSQLKYAEDFVHLANLTDDKKVHTPMEANTKYRKEQGEQTLYRHLVGSLIYLTMSRLAVSYEVEVLSQFVTKPYKIHNSALLRVIRYIRSIVNRSLLFPSSSSLDMVGYADAYWDGCPDSRQSTTGWCMSLGSCMIS